MTDRRDDDVPPDDEGRSGTAADAGGLPPGTFLAPFPWWVVMTRPAAGPAAGTVRPGPDSGFLVVDADGSTCLAVFTDDDLAGRFAAAAGFTGVPTAVARPRDFVALAGYLPPICTYAAFDPPGRVGARARWVLPLAQVLAALRLHDPPDESEAAEEDE